MSIVIYGESHFKSDEVNKIRRAVVSLKPDIIIHELLHNDDSYEYNYYSKRLPKAMLFELEEEINKAPENPLWSKPLSEQFRIRESMMIHTISKIRKKYPDMVIAVIVGDSHLRSTDTPELGEASKLNSIGLIYRSKYKEIL